MAENQSKSTPARVLLLFTLLFAGVTAAAWREAGQKEMVETVDFPTALGDVQFCPVGLLTKGATFPGTLDGHEQPVAFTVVSSSAKRKQEERFWKVGKEAAGTFYIYQQPDDESKVLFIKSAAAQFYEVSVSDSLAR